jgi:hypothetical protein
LINSKPGRMCKPVVGFLRHGDISRKRYISVRILN